jgi:hypothetical protein
MRARLRDHRALNESMMRDHMRNNVCSRPSTIIPRTGSCTRIRKGSHCNAARCICRGFERNQQLKRANLANPAVCTGTIRACAIPGDYNASAHSVGERVRELRRRGGGGQRACPSHVH